MESVSRRTLLRLALLCVSILTALLLVEAGLRAFVSPPELYAQMVYDPDLGFRQQPGLRMRNVDERGEFFYELNEHGFRGPAIEWEDGPADPHRVLFVGDSFLNAWAVRAEELLPFVAERALGEPWSMREACCKDYGTAQELLLLRKLPSSAGTVVLCFYSGNDLINNTIELAGRTRISPGDLYRPYLVPEGGELELRYALGDRARWRARSRLFLALETPRIQALTTDERLELIAGFVPPPPYERVSNGEVPREYLELLREPPAGDGWAAAWRTTEALLRAFRDEVESRGARFILAVIPQQYQVQRDARFQVIEDLYTRRVGAPLTEALDLDYPERRLSAFLREEGMEHVLLLEPLREALRSDPHEPVYVSDGHLAARGHRIAGEAIAELIRASPGAGGAPHAGRGPVATTAALLADLERVDFTDRPRNELIGWGFHVWKGEVDVAGGGWPLERSGQVYVHDRSGELEVAVRVSPDLALPLELRLTFNGEKLEPWSLEEPGLAIYRRAVNGFGDPEGTGLRLEAGRKLPARGGVYLRWVEVRP